MFASGHSSETSCLFVCLFFKVVCVFVSRCTKMTTLKEMYLLKLGSIAFKNLKAIKDGGE